MSEEWSDIDNDGVILGSTPSFSRLKINYLTAINLQLSLKRERGGRGGGESREGRSLPMSECI